MIDSQTLNSQPPVMFVHGAANSSKVWTFWQRELDARGWASFAINLRGHGENNPSLDLSSVTMANYADDIEAFIGSLPQRPILVGWSMGGLICLMVAAENKASACVVLDPSMPAQTVNSSVELGRGEFDASEYSITSLEPFRPARHGQPGHRGAHHRPSLPEQRIPAGKGRTKARHCHH